MKRNGRDEHSIWEPHETFTVRRDGKEQITCRCDEYPFPHRMGGGNCMYHEDTEECGHCDEGYCEFHKTDNSRDLLNEVPTAAERNRGLTEQYRSIYQ